MKWHVRRKTFTKKNFLESCLSYKCHHTFFFIFFTRTPLLFLGKKLGFFRANLAKLFEVGGQSLLLEGSVFKENRVAILFTYYYKVFKNIWRAMAPPLLPMLVGNKEGQIRGI